MKPNLVRHFSAAIFLLCCWITGAEAATHCIWFADDNAIYQVNSDTNQIVQTVAVKEAQGLAMNGSDCSVTVLVKKHLVRFDGNGVSMLTTDLRSLNKKLYDAEQLLIDPYDNSVWLRDEKTLVHIDANGQLIGSFMTQGSVRSMVLALDESIWVLGNKQLSHYSAQGTLLATQDLKKLVNPEPKRLAIDSVGGLLWFAGEKQLVQINLNQPGQATLNMNLPSEASSLALNPLTGELWVATSGRLQSYGRDGALHNTVDLKANHLSDVSLLAFDPVTQTLWVSTERSISRFSALGQFIANLPAKDADEALTVPAFFLTPILSQVRPAQDGITNNPLLTITYGFDAQCNSQACGFTPGYFNSYALNATLNQKAISPFVFDNTTAQSSYTPTTRLPEGLNTLRAQAKDGFMHATNIINSQFVVDTIPPRFLSITPTDGSTVTTAQIVLQGVIDDPTAIVVLIGTGQATTTINGTQLNFSMPVTLVPGPNSFTLTAMDKANNRTTQSISINYQANQVTANISSPVAGTTINGDSTLVTGTIQAPPNTGITINGIVATQSGNQFFAQIPLQSGANTLTLIATTQDGQTLTKTITVTGSGVSPFVVSASPTDGMAPLPVIFTVNNQTANTIQKIEVDFDGNDTIDITTTDPNAPIAFTYTTPGIYQAKLNITDSQGTVTQKMILVTIQDPAQIETILNTQWNSMASALMQGDKAKAMSYLNKQGQEKYGPVFDKLMPKMATILTTFSPLQRMSVRQNIGEFGINRTIDGVNRIFLIYFLKGSDGVWRLDAM